jgi:hypothetical protein
MYNHFQSQNTLAISNKTRASWEALLLRMFFKLENQRSHRRKALITKII